MAVQAGYTVLFTLTMKRVILGFFIKVEPMRLEIPGENFYETPLWWQNFINHHETIFVNTHGVSDLTVNFMIYTSNILQSEYGAVKIYEPNPKTGGDELAALEFNKEETQTWFLLKWS
jgi:hypothetical protein